MYECLGSLETRQTSSQQESPHNWKVRLVIEMVTFCDTYVYTYLEIKETLNDHLAVLSLYRLQTLPLCDSPHNNQISLLYHLVSFHISYQYLHTYF